MTEENKIIYLSRTERQNILKGIEEDFLSREQAFAMEGYIDEDMERFIDSSKRLEKDVKQAEAKRDAELTNRVLLNDDPASKFMLKQLRVNLPSQQKTFIQPETNKKLTDYEKDLNWRNSLNLGYSMLDPDRNKPYPHNILREWHDIKTGNWYFPDPRRSRSHFVSYDENLRRKEGIPADKIHIRIAEKGLPRKFDTVAEYLNSLKKKKKVVKLK